MSLSIIGLIVSLLIPAVIGAHLLEIESSDKLAFYRSVYIDLNSGIELSDNNKYLYEKNRICNKERKWCIDANKIE